MASRILGLVREQVLAHAFGASHQMDAFNVAFRLPNLVRDLFAEGAMTAAFVPTFSRVLTRDGAEAAWTLGRRALTALLLVTTVIAVIGIVFAEPMTWAFAADYAEVPGKFDLTVRLTRFMFPFLPLVAIAGWALFGESLDRWTVLGAAIILSANAYIAHREATLLKRHATTAPVEAAKPGE